MKELCSVYAANARVGRLLDTCGRTSPVPGRGRFIKRRQATLVLGVAISSPTVVVLPQAIASLLLRFAEKFEITVTRHSSRPQVVLNYEDRDRGVLWNHNWPCHTGPREDHLVAFHTDAIEAVRFKDFPESLLRDWAKLWHAPKGAAWKLAE
jgi:hypothetical protein